MEQKARVLTDEVGRAVLKLLEQQAHCLYATLLPARHAAERRLLKAMTSPRPGDWVLITQALQPVEHRIGRLIRSTMESEYTGIWTIEDVGGRLWNWTNCKVLRLIMCGNPYAGAFQDESSVEDTEWAARRRAEVEQSEAELEKET